MCLGPAHHAATTPQSSTSSCNLSSVRTKKSLALWQFPKNRSNSDCNSTGVVLPARHSHPTQSLCGFRRNCCGVCVSLQDKLDLSKVLPTQLLPFVRFEEKLGMGLSFS